MNMHKFEVEMPLDHMKILIELAEKKSLSINAMIRQTIRMYQLVDSGHSKLVEVNPMPKLGVDHHE